MLVHICCSVDSHYFLSELQKLYPQEKLIGFFYNPNIHPRSEHDLRLLDVKRSCKMLGVELHEGKYDAERWCEEVKGFEDEPEKGARCSICFDARLLESAKIAQRLGEQKFTSTLLSSPMKTQEVLFSQGEAIAEKFGLEFVKIDVRSNGGTQKQNELSKKDNLYRQNYCGCQFALKKQREGQGKFSLEFISPLNRQIMPGSIEYRDALFQKRDLLEEEGKPYLLIQENQMVWRCLSGSLHALGEIIPCHILAHSCSKKSVRLGSPLWLRPKHLDLQRGQIGYSRRDDTLLLDLQALNELLRVDYASIQELLKRPLNYHQELALRAHITKSNSLCPILILSAPTNQDLRISIASLFQEEKVFELIEL